MRSAHSEQATAAIQRDWYRADPRAYIRIAALLAERISSGELTSGQATPSITSLCADHGVARQTAAHALHVLQDAGLIHRVPGLGYHVRERDSIYPSTLGLSPAGVCESPAETVQEYNLAQIRRQSVAGCRRHHVPVLAMPVPRRCDAKMTLRVVREDMWI
jgi:DNA-binding transcriptional regulator YhcF (GntR family)